MLLSELLLLKELHFLSLFVHDFLFELDNIKHGLVRVITELRVSKSHQKRNKSYPGGGKVRDSHLWLIVIQNMVFADEY